ncbi:MAG TPA: COX15/CtaA family protein [Chloroflexota bacterium]|nr:COX15/CtaA family protein [Chloroflexota bacterium]
MRALAVVATAGMFLVLVMGATVTNTGSAQGCGQSWPLCNGRLVPEFTVATAIEYSHRAVTGVEGVLVIALATGVARSAVRVPRASPEAWVLVALMVGFLLLQAGLGAWAVMAPQSPLVLASHFGISLIAFASVFLTAVHVFEQPRGTRTPQRATSNGYRRAVLGTTAYVLGVVYLGAYVRHTGASLACPDWPLCNGQLLPVLDAPTGVVFAHRAAALGAVALLGWLTRWSWSLRLTSPELAVASLGALGLAILQALSGAIVVWTRLGLFSTLGHAALVSLLFASLAFLVRRVLAAPASPATARASRAAVAARP